MPSLILVATDNSFGTKCELRAAICSGDMLLEPQPHVHLLAGLSDNCSRHHNDEKFLPPTQDRRVPTRAFARTMGSLGFEPT